MKRFGIWVVTAGLLGSLAAWAGGDCCPKADKAKSGKSDKPCSGCAECKKVCEKLKAEPGTFQECCGKFCASHKDKDGKVTLGCHLEKKCCAENFAKTGDKICADCVAQVQEKVKKAKSWRKAEETEKKPANPKGG